jgi:hypothetical protein
VAKLALVVVFAHAALPDSDHDDFVARGFNDSPQAMSERVWREIMPRSKDVGNLTGANASWTSG